MGTLLSRLHAAFLAFMRKDSLLRGQDDPFATVQGVLDALEQRATERRDMTAVGKLKAARNIVTRESLRGAR
ncbi:hypothetical protein [Brevundimonas sp.]|uniref:hypothetical protein n=1 Tax=Brevundimonas sp. TaxID=1871086 RepID=UPI0028ADDCE2|nr:hypothetical protein [Brevundimonas sp.]